MNFASEFALISRNKLAKKQHQGEYQPEAAFLQVD